MTAWCGEGTARHETVAAALDLRAWTAEENSWHGGATVEASAVARLGPAAVAAAASWASFHAAVVVAAAVAGPPWGSVGEDASAFAAAAVGRSGH